MRHVNGLFKNSSMTVLSYKRRLTVHLSRLNSIS